MLAVAGGLRAVAPARCAAAGSVSPRPVDGAGTMALPPGPRSTRCGRRRPATLPHRAARRAAARRATGRHRRACLSGPSEGDLAAALASRTALLTVWASWCGPCRAEIPALDAYAHHPDAIPVVSIDVRDDAGAALSLLDELGARYPSVVDTDGELWAAWRSHAPSRPVASCAPPGRWGGWTRSCCAPPDEVTQAVRTNFAARETEPEPLTRSGARCRPCPPRAAAAPQSWPSPGPSPVRCTCGSRWTPQARRSSWVSPSPRWRSSARPR
ncbi:TlpA family protein disulfide reductase [Pseudonocardia sp. KRD-169]|nr:TlpA family protein disulfide reductase [Pseudonocardia abyssalis]